LKGFHPVLYGEPLLSCSRHLVVNGIHEPILDVIMDMGTFHPEREGKINGLLSEKG
jgi:hypothetical protein